jgi:hypothetical protein
MRSRIITIGLGLAIAGGLAGCEPGPAGYAGWSNYRQQQADEHAAAARHDAAAADYEARSGHEWSAQRAQAAADAHAARAQEEQDHAARDRWLSQF